MVHLSTGISIFEATYGKLPSSIPQYLQGTSQAEVVDDLLVTRTTIHATLCRHLQKAQASMKNLVDAYHRDVHFFVNGWVYIRLRPHRQTSVVPTYTKLSKRFYGSLQVTKHIGPVAYWLMLLESSKIHHVFNVSLLKRHLSPEPSPSSSLPLTSLGNNPVIEPLSIIIWK